MIDSGWFGFAQVETRFGISPATFCGAEIYFRTGYEHEPNCPVALGGSSGDSTADSCFTQTEDVYAEQSARYAKTFTKITLRLEYLPRLLPASSSLHLLPLFSICSVTSRYRVLSGCLSNKWELQIFLCYRSRTTTKIKELCVHMVWRDETTIEVCSPYAAWQEGVLFWDMSVWISQDLCTWCLCTVRQCDQGYTFQTGTEG